ncbi:MAG TPA: hypothetical protein DIV79_05320 [Opitutae bacterium]|nr:hypothetical protein [Opitutae bacterium]|tara:strand:+ start:1520 stop:1741 length:222 start_codon:yes stop_codon:yes gene_type:complete
MKGYHTTNGGPNQVYSDLLSVPETLKYLGIKTRNTLHCWAYDNKVPSVKVGKRRRYRKADLDTAIEQSKEVQA